MIILRELLAFVIENSRRMVGFWWEFNTTCHHTVAPLLWFLESILLHFFNQVVYFFPGHFGYNSKMTTRISNGSFFFMSKGKGLLLFSIIIPKAWCLIWLECVRKCLCGCYTVASRKPCIWVCILCPWAKHCGKENSLKPVRAHFWIGVEINPKPTIGLLCKVK